MDILVIFGKRRDDGAIEALDVVDSAVNEENDGDWLDERFLHHKSDDVYRDVTVATISVADEKIMSLFSTETIHGTVVDRSKQCDDKQRQ